MAERGGPGAGDEPGPQEREAGDELPEDLDVTALVGPYRFPDVARRRWIGVLHLLVAAGAVAAWAVTAASAMLGAAALLGAVAAVHVSAGWRSRVDETEALVVATRAVGFPVGHASAQMVWRGLRSRPVWRVLLYSSEDPPARRGFVELDAVDGAVIGHLAEENPEDWTDLA